MSTFRQVLAEIAASDLPVLLLGESGVGKHMVASEIHDASPWRDMPLVICDCRLADEKMIRGTFQSQGDGMTGPPATVYFKNLETLSGVAQRTLLSALETNGTHTRRPRVIASGSIDLKMEVQTGRFREELYYGLGRICLTIPPLRYRREEIIGIAEQYLEKYANQFNGLKPELTPQLVRFLQSHPWVGNLRELEDAMRTIVAVGNVKVAIAALQSSSQLTHNPERRTGAEAVSLKQVARAASQRAERELILQVLSRTHWNRKKAAEELRISYKALLYKLKEIGPKAAAVARGGISE